MKKLLTALISAALIAMPLAVISTPASAATTTQVKHAKKGSKAKAKAKSKAKKKAKAKKSSSAPTQ